jgi:hypothetical protein
VHRIAVLDDYQHVAATYADWSRAPEPVDVVEFSDHVADEEALVARLEPFGVVVAMRERTPFPRRVLERLPNLSCSSPPAAGTRRSTSARLPTTASPSAVPAPTRVARWSSPGR